jgi:hypothetical protein
MPLKPKEHLRIQAKNVLSHYKTLLTERHQISLKSPDDIDIALTAYIGILQEAAQQATPTPKPQTRSINIPSEIK